jgi:hypothetical protein
MNLRRISLRRTIAGCILPGRTSPARTSPGHILPRRASRHVALAGLLAVALLLLPSLPSIVGSTSDSTTRLPVLGAQPASAQGPMDTDILLPEFSDLPLTVEPGQTFPLTAATVPGAQCVGHVTFRGFPTTDLDPQTTPDGTCTWDVAVPSAAPPGTATLMIDISRGGQDWSLAGVVYVSPVGGSPTYGQ